MLDNATVARVIGEHILEAIDALDAQAEPPPYRGVTRIVTGPSTIRLIDGGDGASGVVIGQVDAGGLVLGVDPARPLDTIAYPSDPVRLEFTYKGDEALPTDVRDFLAPVRERVDELRQEQPDPADAYITDLHDRYIAEARRALGEPSETVQRLADGVDTAWPYQPDGPDIRSGLTEYEHWEQTVGTPVADPLDHDYHVPADERFDNDEDDPNSVADRSGADLSRIDPEAGEVIDLEAMGR